MHAIFGIRHHGPGSGRSVLAALEQLQPDLVLVEGPPDAELLLPLLIDAAMRPPVALLIYSETDPSKAVYYPFTTFSPEYQAIGWALNRNIPVRLFDLPQGFQFAMRSPGDETPFETVDPLVELAHAAGYEDAEQWWDVLIEQRQDRAAVFDAILEAMNALREAFPHQTERERLREARMRRTLRQAIADGYERIAVICGAWHAPALTETALKAEDPDAARLDMLDSIPVAATWIPWTATRLSRQSGYGAGVTSPGWYRFLWEHPDGNRIAVKWLTHVAQHLRRAKLDASPAQVIDAVRLAETLALLRGRSLPDLHDLNEAALSVLCHGNDALMRLIERDLIIGTEMGAVPPSVPAVPLQRDFHREVTRLELTLSEEEQELTLDLRGERDLEISRFLGRVLLLDLPWGIREEGDYFLETWTLAWDPGYIIQLIEHSVWGNTIEEAAAAYALHRAEQTDHLPELTAIVQKVLLAGLSDTITPMMAQLEKKAAVTRDISQLMEALPPLMNSLRYGDIRQTPSEALRRVIDGLITRITIGLPVECTALDDDQAEIMFYAVIACDRALHAYHQPETLANWHHVLIHMLDQENVHGLLRGRICRIVVDADIITQEETVRQMRLALGVFIMPEEAAAWIQGFLRESGSSLVYDEALLTVLDAWLSTLPVDAFERVLPLLRRTTATFEAPEIRHVGRRIQGLPLVTNPAVDPQHTAQVDQTLDELLGRKGSIADDR